MKKIGLILISFIIMITVSIEVNSTLPPNPFLPQKDICLNLDCCGGGAQMGAACGAGCCCNGICHTTPAACCQSLYGSSYGRWMDSGTDCSTSSDKVYCTQCESEETCNGIDDNCNGLIDDSLSRTCYTGPSGTLGIGICKAGTQTCSNGLWSICTQTLPSYESCSNSLDDDCDGKTDCSDSDCQYSSPCVITPIITCVSNLGSLCGCGGHVTCSGGCSLPSCPTGKICYNRACITCDKDSVCEIENRESCQCDDCITPCQQRSDHTSEGCCQAWEGITLKSCINSKEEFCYSNQYGYIFFPFKDCTKDYSECISLTEALEPVSIGLNEKESYNKYLSKEVFLISDKNWQDVLQLVPVTTWTDKSTGEIHKYPTLIYHEESDISQTNSLLSVTEGSSDKFLDEVCISFYQEFISPTSYLSKVRVWSGGLEATFHVELKDTSGNLIATSQSITTTSEMEKIELIFNVDVIQGNKYKLVWKRENNVQIMTKILYKTSMQSGYDIYPNGKSCMEGELGLNTDVAFEILGSEEIISNAFDADSIIYFMQQYTPSSVTILGETNQELDNLLIAAPELGAGLTQNKIRRIQPYNYPQFWKSFDTIVYSSNNYETALLASAYASLLNAPLVIEGSTIDNLAKETILKGTNLFNGRNVITVNVNCPSGATCQETHNLESLRKRYLQLTNTDKIILVNPNDLNIKVNEEFQPEKSTNPIYEIYSKTSLASPFLASAKHELILNTTSTDYQIVDSFIENKVSSLGINPKYLTIMASPDAIQMGRIVKLCDDCKESLYEVDFKIYGNLDEDVFPELSVGRIFGLTLSDISSYITRDLFYNGISHSSNFAMLYLNAQFPEHKIEAIANDKLLEASNFIKKSKYLEEGTYNTAEDLKDRFYINYLDHGWTEGWASGISTSFLNLHNIWLSNSLVVSSACLTCSYAEVSLKKNLFCTNILRRGALGHVGAIDESYSVYFLSKPFLEGLLKGMSLGESLKTYKIAIYSPLGVSTVFQRNKEDFYILLGDPTITLFSQYPTLELITTDFKILNKEGILEVSIPKIVRDIKYTSPDINFIYDPLFEAPLGLNVITSKKTSFLNYKVFQYNNYADYFGDIILPQNLVIKSIKKVEYIDNLNNIFDITNPGPIEFLSDPNSISNVYHFALREYKSNEPLPDYEIPSHKYKIYIELEEI